MLSNLIRNNHAVASRPESATESIAAILSAGLLRLAVQEARPDSDSEANSLESSPIRLALPPDSPLSVTPTGKRPVRGHTKEVTTS